MTAQFQIVNGERVELSTDEANAHAAREAAWASRVPTAAEHQAAIRALLDQTAQARQYDNALAITSYVGSTIPAWAAEAAAFVAWRDAVWAYALTELAKAQAGQRVPPASTDDFLAELPAIAWLD